MFHAKVYKLANGLSKLDVQHFMYKMSSKTQLDAGGKPSTMVHAGETRRAAANGVWFQSQFKKKP